MKKLLSILFICTLLLITVSAEDAAMPKDKTYNILFIGNSATYYNDMPEAIFAPLAEAAGYKVNVSSITKSGYTLLRHTHANDDYGMQVYAALRQNKYDYVVFQENTSYPMLYPETYYTSARVMAALIEKNGAKPILYATIPRAKGHADYETNGWTMESYTYGTDAAVSAIASEIGGKVAHGGIGVYDVMQNHPEISMHVADKGHPSYNGSYLVAHTVFATIFGVDPRNVDFLGECDATTAEILKNAAYNATFNTPSIPEQYQTTSISVGEDYTDYGIDYTLTKNLSVYPTAPIISVEADGITYPNGLTYSGIRGTKGTIASTEYSATALTDEQKADIGDIGYGVSVIGLDHMYKASSYDWELSVQNLIDGNWSTSTSVGRLHFGEERYDISGNEDASGKYMALITLNFGAKNRFEAIGFNSNNLFRMVGVAEIFVSDDGKTWTKVPSACYDGIHGTTFTNLEGSAPDFKSGKTADYSVMFSMESATGQYIRIGVIKGNYAYNSDETMINPRELVVFGQRLPIGDINLDGETSIKDALIAIKMLANAETSTRADINCDGKLSLLDVIKTLKESTK